MSTPETNQPAESQPQSTKSSGSSTRLLILVLVLLLAIGALAYDQKWARPKSLAAYERIVELSAEINAQGKSETSGDGAESSGSRLKVLTNEDVQAELGKKPFKQTEEDDGRIVEHYRWMGGLPLRYYTVYVVYARGSNDRLLLSAAHLNELPPINEPPSEEFADIGEAGDGAMGAADPSMIPGGPGGPGGGPGGPGGEGRGRGSAEEGDDGEGAAPESAEANANEPAAAPETPEAAAPESESSEQPAEATEPAAENGENAEAETGAEPSESPAP